MLISKHKGPSDVCLGSLISASLYHVTFPLTHALHKLMVGLIISLVSADGVTHHLMLDPALKSHYRPTAYCLCSIRLWFVNLWSFFIIIMSTVKWSSGVYVNVWCDEILYCEIYEKEKLIKIVTIPLLVHCGVAWLTIACQCTMCSMSVGSLTSLC